MKLRSLQSIQLYFGRYSQPHAHLADMETLKILSLVIQMCHLKN